MKRVETEEVSAVADVAVVVDVAVVAGAGAVRLPQTPWSGTECAGQNLPSWAQNRNLPDNILPTPFRFFREPSCCYLRVRWYLYFSWLV
jgi:hypothetical protein